MLIMVFRKVAGGAGRVAMERQTNCMPNEIELKELIEICGLESAFLFNDKQKLVELWYPVEA